jgi:hypothetical protein
VRSVYACIRVCVRSASFMVFKGINSVFGSCSVEIVWTNRTLTNFRFFFFYIYLFIFVFFFLCWIDFYGYRVGELFLPLLIVRAIAVASLLLSP